MVAEFTTDLTENRLWLDDQTTGVLCTPGNGRAARKLGRRAVVVGAGIGELSAAGSVCPTSCVARFAVIGAFLKGESS